MASSSRLTLVLGLGESGLAMARWLARQGEALRVADSREAPPGIDTLRAEVPAAELYQSGVLAGEFARTVSRLEEMQSRAYLESPRREVAGV